MKTFDFNGDIESLKSNENDVMVTNISKEDATKFLACSIGNRNLRLDNVQNLTRSMNNGEYSTRVATSGVAFDVHGRLVNGHHQLEAFLKSKLDRIDIRIELGSASAEHCDEGVSRSVKDSLCMSGKISKSNAYKYAHIVKNIFHIREGRTPTNVGARKEYSKESYISFINNHKNELQRLSYLENEYGKKIMKVVSCSKYEPQVRQSIAYHLIYERGYDEDVVCSYLYGIVSSKEQNNNTIEGLRETILNSIGNGTISNKTPREFYSVIMAGFYYYYHSKNGMKKWGCILKNADEVIKLLNPVGTVKIKQFEETA